MRVYILSLKKIGLTLYIITIAAILVTASALTINLLKNKIEKQDIQASNAESGRIIIIDAGHGGEDPGAIGVNGVYEKDLNLDIAMIIGEMLREKGYTVLYSRTEDKMLYTPEENIKGMRKISDLKNRCALTEFYDDSVFISIHMNTFGSSKYSGLQVYHKSEDKDSKSLAESIQGSVKSILQPDNKRTVKDSSKLYLLENASGIAVLVECGFLSNISECEKLSQKEYQKELSFSIVCGIINYMEETDNKK